MAAAELLTLLLHVGAVCRGLDAVSSSTLESLTSTRNLKLPDGKTYWDMGSPRSGRRPRTGILGSKHITYQGKSEVLLEKRLLSSTCKEPTFFAPKPLRELT